MNRVSHVLDLVSAVLFRSPLLGLIML